MNILFRLDASGSVGLGHLSRCLAIADHLRDHKVIFLMKEDECLNKVPQFIGEHTTSIILRTFIDMAEEDAIDMVLSEQKIDTIVIDKKYDYFRKDILRWPPIILIDRLFWGCELAKKVILPVAHANGDVLYQTRWGENQLFYGAKYVIINRGFTGIVNKKTPAVVVSTGGSDPAGVMLTLIEKMKNYYGHARYLIGSSFVHREKLPSEITNGVIVPWSLKEWEKAGVGVVTFGVSVYELLYLGLKPIVVSHSEENARDAFWLKYNYPDHIIDLGYYKHISSDILLHSIQDAFNNRPATKIIDEHGAKRIAELVIEK